MKIRGYIITKSKRDVKTEKAARKVKSTTTPKRGVPEGEGERASLNRATVP